MAQQVTLRNFFKGRVKTSTVLDYVERKLLEQGHRSINQRNTCAYRGENGDKCAIGFLIPDSQYTPNIEGSQFDMVMLATILPEIEHTHDVKVRVNFLRNMQYIHDRAFPSRFAIDISSHFDALRRDNNLNLIDKP